jgi:hypothetical protein
LHFNLISLVLSHGLTRQVFSIFREFNSSFLRPLKLLLNTSCHFGTLYTTCTAITEVYVFPTGCFHIYGVFQGNSKYFRRW